MFPSSGDLWIYDFIMVNRGGGEPQGVKGQRLALNLQGQEPSLVRQPARRPECHLLQARLATAWSRGEVRPVLHPPLELQALVPGSSSHGRMECSETHESIRLSTWNKESPIHFISPPTFEAARPLNDQGTGPWPS